MTSDGITTTAKHWWMEVTVQIRVNSPKPITASKAFALAGDAVFDGHTDQVKIGVMAQEQIRPVPDSEA